MKGLQCGSGCRRGGKAEELRGRRPKHRCGGEGSWFQSYVTLIMSHVTSVSLFSHLSNKEMLPVLGGDKDQRRQYL